jgi:hypothetical protein
MSECNSDALRALIRRWRTIASNLIEEARGMSQFGTDEDSDCLRDKADAMKTCADELEREFLGTAVECRECKLVKAGIRAFCPFHGGEPEVSE